MEPNLTFENIKNWCYKNEITLIKGFLNQSTRQANMFYICEDDYLVFLQIAKNNNLNEIIYSELSFNSQEEFEELGEYNLPEIIDEYFENYKKYEESVYSITLFITVNGSIYTYICTENWYNEFESKIEEFNTQKELLEEELALPQLPEDIFTKLVRKIAKSDSYYVNHTRPSRIRGVISSTINEELENPQSFDIDMFYLEKHIGNLFSGEFRVKKEKEYILKINDLKNQGKTKKAIISILGITEGIYDSLANKE